MIGEPVPDYPAGATLFWLIRLFGLVFFVPLAITTGVQLLRRDPNALKLACVLAGFAACELDAVAGMSAVMLASGDPSTSPPILVALLAIVGWLAGLTVALFRSYLLSASWPLRVPGVVMSARLKRDRTIAVEPGHSESHSGDESA